MSQSLQLIAWHATTIPNPSGWGCFLQCLKTWCSNATTINDMEVWNIYNVEQLKNKVCKKIMTHQFFSIIVTNNFNGYLKRPKEEQWTKSLE